MTSPSREGEGLRWEPLQEMPAEMVTLAEDPSMLSYWLTGGIPMITELYGAHAAGGEDDAGDDGEAEGDGEEEAEEAEEAGGYLYSDGTTGLGSAGGDESKAVRPTGFAKLRVAEFASRRGRAFSRAWLLKGPSALYAPRARAAPP